MNHVTLLLELLDLDSSPSCSQGGTREPSNTDLLLSFLTSARRDEPAALRSLISFEFIGVMRIHTVRSAKGLR